MIQKKVPGNLSSRHLSVFLFNTAGSFALSEQTQQLQEQVDEIQIQLKCTCHSDGRCIVGIGKGYSVFQLLYIISRQTHKDQNAHNADPKLYGAAVQDQHVHNSCNDDPH